MHESLIKIYKLTFLSCSGFMKVFVPRFVCIAIYFTTCENPSGEIPQEA